MAWSLIVGLHGFVGILIGQELITFYDLCSFTFFKQNVCTVNVHEMYYKFNPGPSPDRWLEETYLYT
jgi:hypothetical protein